MKAKNQQTNKWSQLIVSLFFVSALFSCKKESKNPVNPAPTNYTEIDIDDIKQVETSMSNESINATNAEGIEWSEGDVFVFKTNENRYGKLQVINIIEAENYKFQFRATVYNLDGSVRDSTNLLEIRGTYLCDLDTLVESGTSIDTDFHWNRTFNADTYLNPLHNAKFRGYSF